MRKYLSVCFWSGCEEGSWRHVVPLPEDPAIVNTQLGKPSCVRCGSFRCAGRSLPSALPNPLIGLHPPVCPAKRPVESGRCHGEAVPPVFLVWTVSESIFGIFGKDRLTIGSRDLPTDHGQGICDKKHIVIWAHDDTRVHFAFTPKMNMKNRNPFHILQKKRPCPF